MSGRGNDVTVRRNRTKYSGREAIAFDRCFKEVTTMAIPRNIKQYLFHNNVGYSHKQHSVAYTSQEIAEVEHVPGGEFAKTVVLEADGRMIFAVLPADHVIDFEILKNQVGCSRMSLVPEREFTKMFPTCEPGAMPPFGKLFGLPIYCDSALAKHSEIEFNAGTHIDTVRMTYATFAHLEHPRVAGFSEKVTTKRAA
jgi:Ala-tRNA(Pro) deacylase